MVKVSKLYERLVAGGGTIPFRDFQRVLEGFGFKLLRTRGSHRTYKHPRVPAVLTVQPVGKDAARYQVDRFLELVREYDLHIEV